MNEVAKVGHNRNPFDELSDEIADLYNEAHNWCDGEPISNQKQADEIAKLLEMIRQARKKADEARKEEKRPHDEAAKAVQQKFMPVLESADMASMACKKTLAPWLQKLEDEKRAEAKAKRKEAEEKVRQAREAHQSAQSLEDMEKAEQSLADAKAAEKEAVAAEKDRGRVKGGTRAVSLRTVYRAEITDPAEFARYIWLNHYAEFLDFMQGIADRDVRTCKTDLPGATCIKEQTAV